MDQEKHGVSMEEERQRLEDECRALRQKLIAISERRQQIRRLMEGETTDKLSKWLQKRNETLRRRTQALQEYKSAASFCRLASSRLQIVQKWNVTNDCFFIWHRGPFGTINGLRLGSEVPALPTDPGETDVNGGSNTATGSFGQVEILGYNVGFSGDGIPISSNDCLRVPWVEVNSALGLITLLLSTLEKKQHSGIQFQNELVAMGSTSKLGLRRGTSVTFYNLYSDDSFHFFGKRNFNIALTGLLNCVADAADAVQKRDRTIALPHVIELNARGELTIGALPITYGPDGEQWTRAMKYLLTDLKWLIAFTTKHVDR